MFLKSLLVGKVRSLVHVAIPKHDPRVFQLDSSTSSQITTQHMSRHVQSAARYIDEVDKICSASGGMGGRGGWSGSQVQRALAECHGGAGM